MEADTTMKIIENSFHHLCFIIEIIVADYDRKM